MNSSTPLAAVETQVSYSLPLRYEMRPNLSNQEDVDVRSFLEAFDDFVRRSGWKLRASPWGYVESWENFVAECQEGYDWEYDEYLNDAFSRTLLERLFQDQEMARFEPILSAMKQRVLEADTALRSSFLPNVNIGGEASPWWARGVLARGGQNYTEDIKSGFGIEIPSSAT